MTEHQIKAAIRELKQTHVHTAQRDHIEGLLTAALQCVQKLRRLENG